jgi:hypothetical protein
MCGCTDPNPHNSAAPGAGSRSAPAPFASRAMTAGVPLAEPLTIEAEGEQPIPGPQLPQLPHLPVPGPGPIPMPFPFLPFQFCVKLKQGCYALTYRPNNSLISYEGTLRVDRSDPDGGPDNLIVSGDLYRKPFFFPPIPIPKPPFPPIPDPGPIQPGPIDPGPLQPVVQPVAPGDAGSAPSSSIAAAASKPSSEISLFPHFRPRIPIFPRSRYHSYLKVTSVSEPVIVRHPAKCRVSLVVEQYDYTPPPVGSFTGSFPAAPSRTATITLSETPSGFPWSGPNFEGRWVEGGVDKGSVTLSWVSTFFRRATVEIDVLDGAVAPQPVPDGAGGTEYFDTIYAKHGWDLTIISDQTGVAVPAGVDPGNCWSSGDLHGLMTANRNPATNLDTDWRMHLMVVPAKLGCGRGVMYDTIDVPREGAASFCDDGYPSSDSSNFGVAENQKQRDIPRAFLRSATHEITHTFNQIHQEQETMADNSIMTTTPSVADVLGGPATGAPGVFPDQINLAVNTTVRHHLNHMPDPVIRPGGWQFASWFGASAPQATDRNEFDDSELQLTVTGPSERVVLGQPLQLSWTLTNRSSGPLVVPDDVSLEGLFATATVTDAEGTTRAFRPYVIICDGVRLAELAPGESVSSSHTVFWSSEGFAFPRPGVYTVNVAVSWSAQGLPVGVQKNVEVFVEFPTTSADNAAASLVFTTDVGKWVALGGNAYHLTEAVSRLSQLASTAGGPGLAGADGAAEGDEARARAGEQPRLLVGFEGLLPDPSRG